MKERLRDSQRPKIQDLNTPEGQTALARLAAAALYDRLARLYPSPKIRQTRGPGRLLCLLGFHAWALDEGKAYPSGTLRLYRCARHGCPRTARAWRKG